MANAPDLSAIARELIRRPGQHGEVVGVCRAYLALLDERDEFQHEYPLLQTELTRLRAAVLQLMNAADSYANTDMHDEWLAAKAACRVERRNSA